VLAVAAAAFVTHWLIKISNCQSRSFTILHFSTALRTIPLQQIMNLFAARMAIWRGTAIEIAEKIPAGRYGTVEIRPVLEVPGLPENLINS
jgi:hypothetical protein